MYENEERLTEEEIVDSLRALVKGEDIDCTMLEGSFTHTYQDGGYLTLDNGFVITAPDGSRFQITVKQEC